MMMNSKLSATKLWLAVGWLVLFGFYGGVVKAASLTLSQVPLTIIQQGIDPNILFLMDDTDQMQSEWLGTKVPFQDKSDGYPQFTFGYPQGSGSIYGSNGAGANLPDIIPGFSVNNLYGAQFRSSYINANYYNPAVSYIPWACPAPYPESPSQTGITSATQASEPCYWWSDANFNGGGIWVMPWKASQLGYSLATQAWLNPYNDNNGPIRDLEVLNNQTSGNPSPGTANGFSGNGNTTWVVCSSSGSTCGTPKLETGSYQQAISAGNGSTVPGFWPAVYWNYIGPLPGTSADFITLSNYQRVQICPTPTPTGCTPPKSGFLFDPSTDSIILNGGSYGSTQPTAQPILHETYVDSNGKYYYITGVGVTSVVNSTTNPYGITFIPRSYSQEIRNFAIWYAYYRSRISMARAGTSLAFMQLSYNFRVDFDTVSHMVGGGNPTVNSHEPFSYSSGSNPRTALLLAFNKQNVNNDNTPLRQSLEGVGQWLQGTPANSAPWGTSRAEKAANNQASYLSCRANYTILVSADFWNGDGPDLPIPNADGSQGPAINTPSFYQYNPVTPGTPYPDSKPNTLADVAQYYWETDLQPNNTQMPNDVPTNQYDPAFWQHMVTFTIGMGEVPQLVQAYMQNYGGSEAQAQQAVLQLITDGYLHWPDGTAEPTTVPSYLTPLSGSNPQAPFGMTGSELPAPDANLSTDADDLWHAGVDGHGEFLSAQTPTSFEEALVSALTNIAERNASGASVATNTQKAGQVRTNTQVYQALYHPLNWWGELLAEPVLTTTTSTGTTIPYIASLSAWDASCVLTGGPCLATTGNTSTTTSAESTSIPVFLTSVYTSTGAFPGAAGALFQWGALSSTEQGLLNANGADSYGPERMTYLEGTPASQINCGTSTNPVACPFRVRTSMLGDIVHSSPVWVGYVQKAYPSTPGQPSTWKDDIYPSSCMPENPSTACSTLALPGGTVESFQNFESAKQNRLNLVYVGSNDGMLRGYEAGSYYQDPNTKTMLYNCTNTTCPYQAPFNDGHALLAFVPRAVYKNLVTYTTAPYGRNQHHYYVDATPGTGDLFYNNAWHTWLAGGLGAGGRGFFALDVNSPGTVGPPGYQAPASQLYCTSGGSTSSTTDPSCFTQDVNTSTSPATLNTPLVMMDLTGASSTSSGNFACAGSVVSGSVVSCAPDLGDTFGTPLIRRFHNGEWGIIWGNGYNSVNGQAGIFIALINPAVANPTYTNGGITIYFLSTGDGSSSNPDGIAYVNTADLDGDHVVDYAYAGDLNGNVWRFNLTSSSPGNWHASTYGNGAATPLFTAVNSAGVPQAITTQVQVVSIPSGLPATGAPNRLMVEFGTGKLLEPGDATPNATASGVQSLYGVWDGGLSSWDAITPSPRQYALWPTSFSSKRFPPTPIFNRSNLLQQTITSEIYSTNSSGTSVGLRQTSTNPVYWADLTYGGTPGTQYGWYMDLISPTLGMQGEMLIYNPSIQNGVLVVNTTILGQPSLTCGTNDNGGWTMALDPSNGAMLTFNAFAIQNIADYSGAFSSTTTQGIYSGVTVGAVGSPAYLSYNGQTYMVVSTSSGKTKLVETGFGSKKRNLRLSWRELR